MKISKKHEALNALAEIRDIMRAAHIHIGPELANDFNIVAKRIGSSVSDWCMPDKTHTIVRNGREIKVTIPED